MANHIRNRCPTSSLDGRVPYNLYSTRDVNIKYFRILGTKANVVDKSNTREKMDKRTREGFLVGYLEQTKGYRIYIPKLRKVVVSRDVKFFNEGSQMPNEKQRQEEIIEENDKMGEGGLDILSFPINDEETERDENIQCEDNENPERRLPGRPRIISTGKPGTPKKEYRSTSSNIESDASDDEEDEVFEEANVNYAEIDSYQAIEGENKGGWLEAIRCEFKSLLKNDQMIEHWSIVK